MKTLKVRPVLVETKEKSRICHLTAKGKEFNDLRFLDIEVPVILDSINYELILISLEDEEIEDGILRLLTFETFDEDIETIITDKKFIGGNYGTISEYKVISRQSQISPEYISKFIEQYNNGCVGDLEIDMEDRFGYCNKCNAYQFASYLICNYPFCGGRVIQKTEPKLTNGFVTIVEKEAISYTEEEVLNLIFKYSNDLLDRTDPFLDAFENESATNFTKEWFKENKKNN